MEMKSVFKVLGAKKFKGDVEGVHYDSTKLHVVMDVSERNGTEVGCNAVTLPFGKSDEFEKLKGLSFPLDCELTISMTTKGYEVFGLRPMPAPGQKAA
ncbi:MAG: hypothetical protein QM639_15425 [Rhodocyclaceae bacterium]